MKICPYVTEPCIGLKCSEFIPTHSFTDTYNYSIQEAVREVWCWIMRKEYKEPTFVRTIHCHCKLGVSAASGVNDGR
jgi:hypothetical protein